MELSLVTVTTSATMKVGLFFFIFMKIIHVFNLSINMILDNGLWQVTMWNNEYETDLAIKLSNMSEGNCVFSANPQVYLQ